MNSNRKLNGKKINFCQFLCLLRLGKTNQFSFIEIVSSTQLPETFDSHYIRWVVQKHFKITCIHVVVLKHAFAIIFQVLHTISKWIFNYEPKRRTENWMDKNEEKEKRIENHHKWFQFHIDVDEIVWLSHHTHTHLSSNRQFQVDGRVVVWTFHLPCILCQTMF